MTQGTIKDVQDTELNQVRLLYLPCLCFGDSNTYRLRKW